MIYRRRIIEEKLKAYVSSFACTLLTGARQVGKSTLIDHLFGRKFKTFVFDPVQDIYGVKEDPDLFLRNNPPPVVLDEIQYVPELVSALKRYIDEHRQAGMYIITGSQQWHVMRDLSESLAGRVAMLELPAFCTQEACGEPSNRECWLNAWMDAASKGGSTGLDALLGRRVLGRSATHSIWRGGYPEVQSLDSAVIPGWMQGYVTTYLQRDIRALIEVRDETQFATFLALCAAIVCGEFCKKEAVMVFPLG